MNTRRSHRKSRNGCDQCKQRRVKCDEERPCRNCSRRGTDCTFECRSSATPPSTTRPHNGDFGILSDIRGRMITASTDAPASRPSSQDPFHVFNDRHSEGTWFPQEWTAQDSELMHHYTLHTYRTIARRPQMQETWQVAIPEIAYSYEFLMHGLLGLSALHLAHLKPERYSHYLAGAGFHMSLGLRSYRRIILSPSSSNCSALFCFSSLIMVYIYASPSEHAESATAHGLDSILELIGLCRGTLVLRPYLDQIRESPLEPLFMKDFGRDVLDDSTDRASIFQDLAPHLSTLHALIMSDIHDPPERATFLQALGRLEASFNTIRNADTPLECGMLYVWPLSIEEPFLSALRQRHPVALVLLAFYCAQLRAFEDYWFVGCQGAVWLGHVEAALGGRFGECLIWPRGVFVE
ncbi:hypothetical protein BJX66DRAFT_179686 [Aspergillus keveii]|uniref:Zn(2)-C6 fungal-type domain-containing protein n=1 Tax=Aspergillus keveii TaxID=714993 RepID=A0ABR4FH33_9EURO